jgi:ribonucleotide reductase beta subunit family protein with ferritin-like domain
MSKLFNPIKEQERSIIRGETSGMMILSDNKYDWSFKLYRLMMGNFWINL